MCLHCGGTRLCLFFLIGLHLPLKKLKNSDLAGGRVIIILSERRGVAGSWSCGALVVDVERGPAVRALAPRVVAFHGVDPIIHM